MKRNILLTMCAIVSVSLLTSCATIVSGTHPKVTINGDVQEPVTITTSYMTYENVILPFQVKLRRKHLSGQRIAVKSPNYTYNDIMIDKKTNGWAWGNLALGGLIGWIVDLATNCVSEPREYQYYVHAESETRQESKETFFNQKIEVSPIDTLLVFPCHVRIEKKDGESIKCQINTLTKDLINITEKRNGKTYNIETRKIKDIRINIEDSKYHRPSFPCSATISIVDQFPMYVTIIAMEKEYVIYKTKKKTYTKQWNKIEGIGFLYPNSMEKYNCNIYFYEKYSL